MDNIGPHIEKWFCAGEIYKACQMHICIWILHCEITIKKAFGKISLCSNIPVSVIAIFNPVYNAVDVEVERLPFETFAFHFSMKIDESKFRTVYERS